MTAAPAAFDGLVIRRTSAAALRAFWHLAGSDRRGLLPTGLLGSFGSIEAQAVALSVETRSRRAGFHDAHAISFDFARRTLKRTNAAQFAPQQIEEIRCGIGR